MRSPDRPHRLLVVDDDAFVAESLATFLREQGYAVDIASSVIAAEEALRNARSDGDQGQYSVVLTEIALPGRSGLELLRTLRESKSPTVALAISGYGTVQSAVEAVRLGAIDFLSKPIVDEELALAVERAIQQQSLLAENRSLRQQLDGRHGLDPALDNVVGTDPRMLRIWELIAAVAPTRTTVLMTGESGTGKSLIARAIHRQSPRSEKPFVELSCGSIPETLLESELFGHVKGAFTGAHADKKGRFLAAHGGTLFLDEINSASQSMQLKLLRVLQERRFEPVGSSETIEVDVRVILASNQPLEQLVAAGQFRQDLYYRINVVAIELPPLRDRVVDIPHLANHFLLEHCREHHRQIAGFAPETMELLCHYPFPGNVRELENIVERAVVLAKGGVITPAELPSPVVQGVSGLLAPPTGQPSPRNWPQPAPPSPAGAQPSGGPQPPLLRLTDEDDEWVPMTLEEAMREPERRILLKALRANQWNRQKTATQLGINRTTLYKKMRSLGVEGLDRAG